MNKLSALSWQIKAERAESELARVTAERDAAQQESARVKSVMLAKHDAIAEENARLRGEVEALQDRITESPHVETYVEDRPGERLVWLSDNVLPDHYEGHRVALVRL